jgi:hypothetical protein
MRDRQREIEQQMADRERAIAEHERELASFRSAEESQRRMREIDGHRAANEKLMEEWSQLTEALEAAG